MKTYKCTVCGAVLGTKWELRNHELKHQTTLNKYGIDIIKPPRVPKNKKKDMETVQVML